MLYLCTSLDFGKLVPGADSRRCTSELAFRQFLFSVWALLCFENPDLLTNLALKQSSRKMYVCARVHAHTHTHTHTHTILHATNDICAQVKSLPINDTGAAFELGIRELKPNRPYWSQITPNYGIAIVLSPGIVTAFTSCHFFWCLLFSLTVPTITFYKLPAFP